MNFSHSSLAKSPGSSPRVKETSTLPRLSPFPILNDCQRLEARLTVDLPCLCITLWPLGVPPPPHLKPLASVEQGSLPASQSVCMLGRDDPAGFTFPQHFPHHSAAAVHCSSAQCEGLNSHIAQRQKDCYVVERCTCDRRVLSIRCFKGFPKTPFV